MAIVLSSTMVRLLVLLFFFSPCSRTNRFPPSYSYHWWKEVGLASMLNCKYSPVSLLIVLFGSQRKDIIDIKKTNATKKKK